MPPFEVLLPAGAIGLYVFDCILPLYANELIFVRRSGRWKFDRGSGVLLAGRRLYLPNPLTPAIAQFRVRWSEADTRGDSEQRGELEQFLRALRPVKLLVLVLLLLLIALPAELYLFGTGVGLLVLMGCFYGAILTALAVVFARRRQLGVSVRSFAALAFDVLACAPFAINLVRKLCLRRSLAGNPIRFASHSFEPGDFAELIDAVSATVGAEQQREYGQTARWLELEKYRKELTAMRPAGPRVSA